jgi:hypothetical protein
MKAQFFEKSEAMAVVKANVTGTKSAIDPTVTKTAVGPASASPRATAATQRTTLNTESPVMAPMAAARTVLILSDILRTKNRTSDRVSTPTSSSPMGMTVAIKAAPSVLIMAPSVSVGL